MKSIQSQGRSEVKILTICNVHRRVDRNDSAQRCSLNQLKIERDLKHYGKDIGQKQQCKLDERPSKRQKQNFM
jgi:hypothetical protein